MSDAELTDAEINERVALAMGIVNHPYPPDFLHDDAAFVALLRWHAAEKHHPCVFWSFSYNEWTASLHRGLDLVAQRYAATPHRALALATLAVRR